MPGLFDYMVKNKKKCGFFEDKIEGGAFELEQSSKPFE
jgi:hypothetical protein